ncbi:MAG: nucleotidyltransferase family protein [Rhodoglobus sp.]
MADERGLAGTISLSRSSAVQLATAWLWNGVASLGVRSLVIKGPIADELGLRPPRASSDVDLLVEPGGADEVIAFLQGAGWYERFAPSIPWVMEFHSRTFIHDGWPIDLDIHNHWPGFLREKGEVFETLWARRESHSMAGLVVDAPDKASMTLILALHSLRDPEREQSRRELPLLVTTTLDADAKVVSTDLLAVATSLGADQTAGPFLRSLGLSPQHDAAADEALLRWRLMTGSKVQTRAWLLALAEAPLRARPRLLLTAIFPPATELRGQHPDLAPGALGLLTGWTRRLINGARDFAPSVRDILRYRLTRSNGPHRD